MGDCRITMTALPGQNEAAEMWSGSLAKGRRRRAGAVGCAEMRKELLKNEETVTTRLTATIHSAETCSTKTAIRTGQHR